MGTSLCKASYEARMQEGRNTELRHAAGYRPQQDVELPLSPEDQQRSICANSIDNSKKEFTDQMARRDFKSAADGMRACAALLGDPFIQKMVDDADTKAARKH